MDSANLIATAKGYSLDNVGLTLDELHGNTVFDAEPLRIHKAPVNFGCGAHNQGKLIVSTAYDDGEGETYTQTFILPYVGLDTFGSQNMFLVKNDGSLEGGMYIPSANDDADMQVTISGIPEDGYVFDNWDINGTKYHAGDVITFDPSQRYTCTVNYNVPGDNPGTETTGGIETLTAQTGDNVSWAVPFLMLCVLGSATVIARRKCFTK